MDTKRQIDIMGIVNLTDDSYFAESRCADVDAALGRVEKMVAEGADIIDFGACSTRPGSLPVGEDEEWRRLSSVLPEIRAAFPDVRLSVDTYWSSVVERTYDCIGDFIVNDISAGEDDPLMLPVVGRLGLEYIAMHKKGTPLSMQSLAEYEDVTTEVAAYFIDFADRACKAGVMNWILDPGFGFAKTLEQNYSLLSDLSSLKRSYAGFSPRILVGISRKSMVYKALGISPEEALPATQSLHMAALIQGADVLRVHDVKEAKETVTLYRLFDFAKKFS
jgi:dihydropteroate synthase